MTLLYDEVLKYEYLFRLNRTLDYIRDHCAEDLTLAKLAKVACFSKYHFHRIFRTLLGETVNRHVRRVRLEKAVRMLTFDKDKSIIDIALDCGFSSSQNFAKAFKAHFGGCSTLRLQPLFELPDPNLVLNCRLPDHNRDRRLSSANILHPIVLAKRS